MIKEVVAPVRRALRWHRRLLAAGFAMVAVYCTLAVLTEPEPGITVLAAARPVPAGATLAPADLTELTLPPHAAPEGFLTDPEEALGRTVVAHQPARAVLTVSSLTATTTLVAPGRVALPVTLAATAPVALLRAGDTIDLLGVGGTGAVEVLARAVRVVTITLAEAGGLVAGDDPVVLVDLTPDEATRVVAATAAGPLAFALR